MTRADDVVVAYPLFQADRGGSNPTSALQLRFHVATKETFFSFNRRFHSRLPRIGNWQSLRICYYAEFDERIYACAAWSNPVARMLPQDTWLELRRFVIHGAPKNTASRMLSWMAKDLRLRYPQTECLISYQDTDAHSGTIYKASGWTQGIVNPDGNWNRPNRFRPAAQSISPKIRWERHF